MSHGYLDVSKAISPLIGRKNIASCHRCNTGNDFYEVYSRSVVAKIITVERVPFATFKRLLIVLQVTGTSSTVRSLLYYGLQW